MHKRTAGLTFLGICLVVAILLLARVITPLVGGGVFALALIAFGLLSQGFRKE